jgi:O-antigen/teichoic acid export membrane protein
MPVTTSTGLYSKVTYPVMCGVQDNDQALVAAYKRLLRLSVFIIFPVMFGIVALARPLILCLITDKWASCIPLLRILCFASMWYPVHALNLNLLNVRGRSDLYLKAEVIKKIIGLAIIIISVPFGITVLCFGAVLSSLIALAINIYFSGKLVDFGFWKQMKNILPAFSKSLVMALIIIVINNFIENSWIQLFLGFFVGVVFYIGVSLIVGPEDLLYLRTVLMNYFKWTSRER